MIIQNGPATHIIPVAGHPPITFIATPKIVAETDPSAITQAINAISVPGVTKVVLSPDCHSGYGVPVGCILANSEYIMPGPVGPDIACSMSYLKLDLPGEAVADKATRRALINAICERIPTGANNRIAKKGRTHTVEEYILKEVPLYGANSSYVLDDLGIPLNWVGVLESPVYRTATLEDRAMHIRRLWGEEKYKEKLLQLGSYGGGNHFGECQVTSINPTEAHTAAAWGLEDDQVGFLSHCGSRGYGYNLSSGKHGQFAKLENHFNKWRIPFPGGDKHLVYAPVDSQEGRDYIDDMYLGANFAIVNHLLINALVLEAFQEVIPGTKGDLLYHISHNLNREEIIGNSKTWVHRKGATRAVHAYHHSLKGTNFFGTGHPILLPGNPIQGSRIMVAAAGSANSLYSINHGAGRRMGRKQADRTLDQATVDAEMDKHDVLSNCRQYPKDEAADAYKDFNEVCQAVEDANLATTVATLRARFVIKDPSQAE